MHLSLLKQQIEESTAAPKAVKKAILTVIDGAGFKQEVTKALVSDKVRTLFSPAESLDEVTFQRSVLAVVDDGFVPKKMSKKTRQRRRDARMLREGGKLTLHKKS